jgi:hypothetical protein
MKPRILALATAIVTTLPFAAMAQTVSAGGSGSVSVDLGGVLSGLLGSVTGVLGGLGL